MMNSINNLNNPNIGYATAATAQAQNNFQAVDAPESFAAGLVRADQELDRLLGQIYQISNTLLGDNPKQGSATAPQPVPNGVFDALQLLGGRMNNKLLEASDMLNRIQNKLT